MSPTQFHQRESKANNNNAAAGLCPPPLKINKDSHFIKKSSSPSASSSSSSTLAVATPSKQPHRHPVIIYTHSPKVIHTHPKDFLALVQKLTGLSRSDDDQSPQQTKSEDGGASVLDDESKCVKIGGSSDDNESGSSVITTEENCDGQVNSCLLTPIFDPPPPQFLSNMPVFTPSSAEFFCSNRPFYNFGDSVFYSQNMRSSLSSSSLSGFDAINEYRDY